MAQNIPPFENPKPHLVVVRAGAGSLHQNWLETPDKDRSWDLIVSYFDAAAYKAHKDQAGVQAILIKGGKWDGLYKTFAAFEARSSYTHIWLPDDDIATNGADINAMFAQAASHALAVCQPSLTPESYFSHFMFMTCPGFTLRYTNYIEIMIARRDHR